MGEDGSEGSRARAAERHYRAQRMESLGTLAGGIAHDMNNVLAPILIAAQLLAADETDAARLRMLESIETSVLRGADMTRRVLTFARGEDGERTVVAVEPVIDQLEAFCRNTLPKSITLVVRHEPGLWPVLADGTQIMQVLMNLVTNARDAMPDGGVLTIGARNRTGLLGEAVDEGAEYVVIEVEDDGSGMGADTLSRVFEPFFTTKAPGRGTGLGLSTSIAIVRGHGGDLEVYSEAGSGTRFGLKLPRAGSPAPVADGPVRESMPPLQGDGELVLVVDDESAIRLIVEQALTANGYRTMPAADGAEAISLLEQSGARVDLVLTDMMMPVMDGAALAAYLLEHHPDVPLIVSSGLTGNAEVARAAHSAVDHFLLKPFSIGELLGAVQAALASTPRRSPPSSPPTVSGCPSSGSTPSAAIPMSSRATSSRSTRATG